jgi:hypothetical protein
MSGPGPVLWEVASDDTMRSVVKSGTFEADTLRPLSTFRSIVNEWAAELPSSEQAGRCGLAERLNHCP